MSKIKLVVFDIAGTTVKDNDNVHNALIEAMKRFGYPVNREEANAVMGYPKPDAIRALLELKEPDTDSISSGYVGKIFKVFLQVMSDFYTHSAVEGTLNAEATFAELHKRNIKVGLDTGFSSDITSIVLSKLQWIEKGLVDFVVSSNEVEEGRPHPYMIHALMKKAGVTSIDEVAKVGDTLADLQEGMNAKTKLVIGVSTGAFSKEELLAHPHTHIVDNLLEILPIIDQA